MIRTQYILGAKTSQSYVAQDKVEGMKLKKTMTLNFDEIIKQICSKIGERQKDASWGVNFHNCAVVRQFLKYTNILRCLKGWHSNLYFTKVLQACYHYTSLGRSDGKKYNRD